MSDENPYLTWLRARYGKADNPLGDLAHELKRAYGLPSSGDMRDHLADHLRVPQWMLDTYDQTWAEWRAMPSCFSTGCAAKAVGGASAFCAAHGGRFHHAAGSA